MNLEITDNAYKDGHEGWSLIDCIKNQILDISDCDQIKRDLNIISDKRLSEIVDENPDLLIFPSKIGAYNDGIDELRICSFDSIKERLYTGNIMGFIGVNETQLTIKSRFTSKDEDYFLHYMLMKVFCPNIFKWFHDTSCEPVFDFLLYLFPYFFNDAMRQGLFKQYKHLKCNDSKVKGNINVPRHIRTNIPFSGRIAYNTREYSYDNSVTELIRHTIEFIKRSPIGRTILQDEETKANVRLIIEVTSSYSHLDLRKVLIDNQKRINHPYFTKYTLLQKLCLSILKRHKLKYGVEKNKVYGILFDGAWLWEEFLNTIFVKWNLLHSENKTGRNPIFLFENKSYLRYPDFFLANETVVDAKYKRLTNSEISRDDIHQIITYLHVLNANSAYIAYPKDSGVSTIETIGQLNGMKGTIGKIGLKIPQDPTSFRDFQQLMETEIDTLNQLWNRHNSNNNLTDC